MRELVKAYHGCRALPYEEFRAKKEKGVNNVGFFVGQSFSNLSFGEPTTFSNSSYLHNSKFETSAQPSFGLMAIFSGQKPSSVLAIQSEIVYTKADFTATSVYINDVANYYIKQTSITTLDYSRLSLLGGLRLMARSNTLNPYFSFGLAAQTFLSMNSNVNQTTEINSAVVVEEFELSNEKNSFAVWAAAGLKKNIFGNRALFLDVNYENSYISNSGRMTVLASRIGFMF